jgi:hypothetical protein
MHIDRKLRRKAALSLKAVHSNECPGWKCPENIDKPSYGSNPSSLSRRTCLSQNNEREYDTSSFCSNPGGKLSTP